MTNELNAFKLSNLAEMTDEEIDAFASQIWDSLPKDDLTKHLAGQHDQSTHAHAGTAKEYKRVDDLPVNRKLLSSTDSDEIHKLTETVRSYCSFNYSFLNGGLRGPKNDSHAVVSQDNPEFIEFKNNMDKTFELCPTLTEPIIVYRGIASKEGEIFEVGKTYQDKGFVSTSVKQKVASGFGGFYGDTKTVMKITVPKKTKVLVPTFIHAGFSQEAEVILNRGTKFKIISKQDTIEGTVIEAEIVK